MAGAGVKTGLARPLQLPRAGTEVGDLLRFEEAPEPIGVGIHRMSAVTDHPGTAQQSRGPEVPHHPTQCGLPEEHVLCAEIGVQRCGLEVFQHHAAVAVHDSLGCAGGAGGEQHPQRVIEGHRRDIDCLRVGDEFAVARAVDEQQVRFAR